MRSTLLNHISPALLSETVEKAIQHPANQCWRQNWEVKKKRQKEENNVKSRGQKPNKNYKYSNERKMEQKWKYLSWKNHMSINVLGVPEKNKQMPIISKIFLKDTLQASGENIWPHISFQLKHTKR